MQHSALKRAQTYAQNIHLNERRQTVRYPIQIHTAIWDKNYHIEPVLITNISPDGLLAEGRGKYQIGAHVSFALPQLGDKEAIIRWSGNNLIGCEFLAPMSEEFFHDLIQILSRP